VRLGRIRTRGRGMAEPVNFDGENAYALEGDLFADPRPGRFNAGNTVPNATQAKFAKWPG